MTIDLSAGARDAEASRHLVPVRTEPPQHALQRLWRHFSKGFQGTAFGKSKDLVESDPTGFGECPFYQVDCADLHGVTLLRDRGDGYPDEVGVPIRWSQDHHGAFLG